MSVPGIDLARIRVILLDIEGTATPVEFVYEVLFPYARANLEKFLSDHTGDPRIRQIVASLLEQRKTDIDASRALPPWISGTFQSETASAADYALWLMDHDSKLGSLKLLQGLIWRHGYESGRLAGQVYPDVPGAFDRWQAQGKEIAIYSSGSELAQKLLFGSTEFGDLTPHISRFFDTQIGAKRDVSSYRRIATELYGSADSFLFLSDVVEELDAARSAGMKTALVIRSAKDSAFASEHPMIQTFDSLV